MLFIVFIAIYIMLIIMLNFICIYSYSKAQNIILILSNVHHVHEYRGNRHHIKYISK